MSLGRCFLSQRKVLFLFCGLEEAKQPRYSNFIAAQIHNVTLCLKLMSDFLDITEEHQNDLLAGKDSAGSKPSGSRRRQIAGAAGKFVNLNSKARDLFRLGVGLNTLADVEQRVATLLTSVETHLDCEDMLTPMQRLVGHAVAEFHSCKSRTNNCADGTRSM